MSFSASKILKGLDASTALTRQEVDRYLQKERQKKIVQEVVGDIPKVNKMSRLRFNRDAIRSPWSRLDNKRKKLTPDQTKYMNAIDKHGRLILIKTRKGGFTEAYLRKKAQDVFTRDLGSDIVMLAGNSASIAHELLDRLDVMYEDGITDQTGKHWRYGDIISNYKKSSPAHIEFYHDTRIFGLAASNRGQGPNIRGMHKIRSMFLTESAHTGLRNDTVVLNAMTANLANVDNGELVLESTGNGKQGITWNVWNGAQAQTPQGHAINDGSVKGPNGFARLLLTWESAVKYRVISQAFIDAERKNPTVDFAQEYCGQFTSSKNATFDDDEINYLDPTDDQSIDLTEMLGH